MFDVILDKIKNFFKSRLLPLIVVYIAFMVVIIFRLFELQIVQGETHSETQNLMETRAREIKSTRGNIFDMNGVILAYNELSYSVMLEDSSLLVTNDEKNTMIYKLIQIIEKNGDSLDSTFPIEYVDGKFEFTISGNALLRFKKTAYSFDLTKGGDLKDYQVEATAQDVFNFLAYGKGKNLTMFGISTDYSLRDTLKIMSLRYDIFSNYPKYVQITVASKINEKTIAEILENQADMPGVEIKQQTSRVYNQSEYFAHILGYTGLANAEELEELNTNEKRYDSTDFVGKSGIEKEFETYLAGTKGSELVTLNNANRVVSTKVEKEPVAGNDLYLTINADLQTTCYELAERELAGILLSKITQNMDYGTKTESANNILTPIYEVYYALLDNNIIDIEHFNDKDASETEKKVWEKYNTSLADVMEKLVTLLEYNSETTKDKASKGMDIFLDFVYELLVDEDILLIEMIPAKDETFTAFKKDKISLSKFLQYTISNNYINLSKLNIGTTYYSSQELYTILVNYIKNTVVNNSEFNKIIYRNLVFSYKLSGLEISLLLFDQGVLEYNEDEIRRLNSGSISAYNFITGKIKSLDITPAMLALEPYSCSIVITDVNTGEVRALVTYPSYDNNMLANKVDAKYYTKLINDNTKPLINRATMQRTAPGSTFKMLSAVTSLEERVVTTYEKITDLGEFDKITPSAKCHVYPSTHGKLDTSHAIKYSCNYYFYEMGWRLSLDSAGKYVDKLGISKLAKYAAMFGLNEKSGIELSEAKPLISDDSAVRSAIGQGTNSYAPVHLSKYISTIANRGTCYNLTLLKSIKDKDGNMVLENKPSVYYQLSDISKSTWDTVQKGMFMVANEQGGSVYKLFSNLGVDVSAKTGTAQISKSNPNHALFVSYAPSNDPEISVAVVIPNGHTSGNAAELGNHIYKYCFGLATKDELLSGEVSTPQANTAAFSD